MKRAAVLGCPIAHSLSPAIHNRWLRLSGIDGAYMAFETPEHLMEARVQILAEDGFAGVNVTAPLKDIAADIADITTPFVDRAQAANVLVFDGGQVVAHNTDGPAILKLVERAGWDRDPVLILGAGGVARAAAVALLDAGARHIHIHNRTHGAADMWIDTLADDRILAIRQLRDVQQYGLVMNCTPVVPAVDVTNLNTDTIVMDLCYTPVETPFLRAAKMHGCPTIDGLQILIEQARPSFAYFFNTPAPDGDIYADMLNLQRDDVG